MNSENSSPTTSSDEESFHVCDLQSTNSDTIASNIDRLQTALGTSPLRKAVFDCSRQYQTSLNEWADYRTNVIRVMNEECTQLNLYRKNCFVATAAGSSSAIVGSIVAFVGFAVFPPLAIGALIIAVAGGSTGLVSQCSTMRNQNRTMNRFREYIGKDEKLLKTTMHYHNYIVRLENNIMENEYFQREMNREIDIKTMATSVLCLHSRSYLEKYLELFGVISHLAANFLIIFDEDEILPLPWPPITVVFTYVGMMFSIFMLLKCFKNSLNESKLANEIEKICALMETELETILMNKASTNHIHDTIEV